MGIFRKEESTHFERDEEGRVVKTVREEEPRGFERKPALPRKDIPLTREEQLEPKRMQPWQTPRGKHTIKKIGEGIKRVDKAVVSHNRRQPVKSSHVKTYRPSSKSPSYQNYNPFGTWFDTGMPKPRAKPKTKKKYTVIKGKAYPIANVGQKSSSRKRKGKKRRGSNLGFGFDPMNAFKF